MVNYREILRLKSLGYTQRQIAASVHSSRSTISEVLDLARKHGIAWPLEESVSNTILFATFYPDRLTAQKYQKGAGLQLHSQGTCQTGCHVESIMD